MLLDSPLGLPTLMSTPIAFMNRSDSSTFDAKWRYLDACGDFSTNSKFHAWSRRMSAYLKKM
jgi:hypothetical protein